MRRSKESEPEKAKTLELHDQSFQQLTSKVKAVRMKDKAVKRARKPNKNSGFHKVRLGPMETHRKREEEPSYARLLLRFRLIGKRFDLQTAYAMWQRICTDPEVIRLSLKREAKKVFLPSVAAPYTHGARVLASMSEQQLEALRQRVGVA
jgi:hypothetical protein